MLAEFGYGVLVVTFVLALYSVGAAIYGYFNKSAALVESARRSMLLTFPLLTVAAVVLDHASGARRFPGPVRVRGDQQVHAHLP